MMRDNMPGPAPGRRGHGGAGRRRQDRRRTLRRAGRALRARDASGTRASDLMDYSERMLRREIEALPDGTYEAEGLLDGFVDHPDPGYRDLRVKVAVTVAGSDIHVDLTGTAPAGRPPDQHAARGHRRHRRLGDAALDPAGLPRPTTRCPTNSGLFRPIAIDAPEGTIANPRFPAPTIARFCGGNIVADTLMRALAPVLPGARQRGRRQPQGGRVLGATATAGTGCTWTSRRGATAAASARTAWTRSTRSTQTPATTRSRTSSLTSRSGSRRYELLEDAGGPGRWRGGLGSVREIEMLPTGASRSRATARCTRRRGCSGAARAHRAK